MKTLLLLAVLLGNVVNAFSQQIIVSAHASGDYDAYSAQHQDLFLAGLAKDSGSPIMLVTNSDQSLMDVQSTGWTNGQRDFTLTVSTANVITFGLQSDAQGDMQYATITIPGALANTKTLWIDVDSATPGATQQDPAPIATMHIGSLDGQNMSASPYAYSQNTVGQALQICGFSTTSTLTISGWLQDPSDVNSSHTVNFILDAYASDPMASPATPEPTPGVLAAMGAALMGGLRRFRRRLLE